MRLLQITCITCLLLAGCSSVEEESKPTSQVDKPAPQVDKPESKVDHSRPQVDKVTVVENVRLEDADAVAVQPVAPQQAARMVQMDKAAPNELQMPVYAPGVMRQAAPADPYAGEKYAVIERNGVQQVAQSPVSTFSIDVDTGAYSNVRRFLNMGRLPPADAVRIEEMINYFSYDYEVPARATAPFSVTTELAPSPWNEGKHLFMVGLKGFEVQERLPANLVFLIDVSGSMQSADKLGLVKSALRMLTRHVTDQDRIAIVTYAGNAGVLLDSVPGSEKNKIDAAIAGLSAGGSTYGEGGLREAYRIARAHFRDDAINRVILATDGDFNVGISDVGKLKDFIADQRKHGIGLTTLGFGTGNYNDELMEQLADVGNGNYAYVDSLNEARKVLVKEASSTFQTIASDVKIQIEFNPAVVAEYRLVGYENRKLAREDFNNDKVDAGEIGAGHTVTALYEIAFVDGKRSVDPLRYQHGEEAPKTGEVAFVKLRYKKPGESRSTLLEQPVMVADVRDDFDEASDNLKFAAAVAGFGQLLRDGEYMTAGYDEVLALANKASGKDIYRTEFVNLVELARDLATPLASR